MKKLVGVMMVVAALAGCTATSAYDTSPDIDPGAVAAAKADGAFGSTEINLGDRASGNTSGTALALFALGLEETDQVRVTVTRTTGDLNPAAYLYRGTTDYIAPDDYEVSPGSVTLDYTIPRGGLHHIVVKAYRGEGAGDFELTTECTGGACAGISTNAFQRQSDCIEAAAQCAIADLPRWGGSVGPARSQNIFNGCLDAQADPSCGTACDGEGAAVCGGVVEWLPILADRTTACHDILNSCLDDCAGMGGFYDPSSLGETASLMCWDGYHGDCLNFISDHEACNGDAYAAGTVGECRARCEATEGAWDEGPWDGCMSECDDLAREHDGFIREVADEAGEYVDIDGSPAFAVFAFDDAPYDVRWRAEARVRVFDEEAAAAGRTDTAQISEEKLFSITRNGEIVGYMVGIEYAIDDPRFDGGGENLYFNLNGEIVHSAEWSG